MEKTKQMVSMAIGIVVVIAIILSLIWLSNSTKNGGWLKGGSQTLKTDQANLSPEETAQILQQLSKPAVDASGKNSAPLSAQDTSKILKQLSQPVKTTTGQNQASAVPSPEQTAKILQQLSQPAK